MTTLTDRPPAPDLLDRPRPGLRRKQITLVVLGILVVAAAGLLLASRTAIAGVRVFYDAQPLVCEGTEVGLSPADDGALRMPAVSLTADMACTMRIQVSNDGWSEVNLDMLDMALMGTASAMDFTPMVGDPSTSDITDAPGMETDARVMLQHVVVPPGETRVIEANFTYGGAAQMLKCSSISADFPTVYYSAFGSSGAQQPGLPILFVQGDPAGCE